MASIRKLIVPLANMLSCPASLQLEQYILLLSMLCDSQGLPSNQCGRNSRTRFVSYLHLAAWTSAGDCGGRFGGLPGLAPPVQRIIVMSKFQTKQPGESRSCRLIQSWMWSNQIRTKWRLAWCPMLSQHLRDITLKQGTRQQLKRWLITAMLTYGRRWVAECYSGVPNSQTRLTIYAVRKRCRVFFYLLQ